MTKRRRYEFKRGGNFRRRGPPRRRVACAPAAFRAAGGVARAETRVNEIGSAVELGSSTPRMRGHPKLSGHGGANHP